MYSSTSSQHMSLAVIPLGGFVSGNPLKEHCAYMLQSTSLHSTLSLRQSTSSLARERAKATSTATAVGGQGRKRVVSSSCEKERKSPGAASYRPPIS